MPLFRVLATCALAVAARQSKYRLDASLVDWEPGVEAREEFRFPFAAKYDDGKKKLFYVAGDHSSGMGPNLKTVKAMFDELKPQAVLVEGMRTEGDYAYRAMGVDDFARDGFRDTSESPYAMWLAAKAKVPARGGEPTDKMVLAEVLKRGYTARDMLGFFTVRMVPGWRRDGVIPDEESFRAKAVEELADDRRRLGVKEPFGYAALLKWYAQQGAEVPLREARYQDMGPERGEQSTRLQKISFAVDQVRQARFNSQLEDLLNRFDRVLVVYGGSHLCRERAMLEKALGAPTNVKPY
ncbi:hypothetical protein EPO15_12445 [bacterium]|nr:MAG: hypothetical protein EPO15_12445 [bacterium]